MYRIIQNNNKDKALEVVRHLWGNQKYPTVGVLYTEAGSIKVGLVKAVT